MVEAAEQHSACLDGCAFRVEFGEAARNRVGIHELMHTQGASQQIGGRGGFAGAIRPGQHDEMRALRRHR